MLEKIKVLVAGEQGLWREGLQSVLKTYHDFDVVGETVDGEQVLDQLSQLRPDVIVMDTRLKVMSGLEATRSLLRQYPQAKVIFIADRDIKEFVVGAFVAGASGCMPKNSTSEALVSAARTVYHGDLYLHPSLTGTMVRTYLAFREHETVDPYDRLTRREKEVLRLLAEGKNSTEIANELTIAVKTARGHIAWTMKKLNINRRGKLIRYALRKGLADPGPSLEI